MTHYEHTLKKPCRVTEPVNNQLRCTGIQDDSVGFSEARLQNYFLDMLILVRRAGL